MSGNFRRIYPEKNFLFFDGGKNSKYERSLIADDESPDCQNVVIDDGAVETRQGVSKLNTAAVGSFVGDGIYTRRDRSTAETMVAFWNGTMYALAGTTFSTVPSAQSVFTAGIRVGAAQDENYLFAGNGSALSYKYNGTDFTRHGIYAPTATASVASNGAGLLTASGQYRYRVTYLNSALVESDVGPATPTFTISSTSGQNRISSLPVAPQSHGVASRVIYRTASSGTTFLRLTTINDNTTATYDDNTPDSGLGVAAPTDNGVPPSYNAIIFHPSLGRLFMNDPANPGLVWWTEAGNPYTVGSLNFQAIGDNTSDLVKGFAIQDNSLIVFCENSISIGYFPDNEPENWKWITSSSPFGSKSPYCLLRYENRVLFPAVQNGKLVGFADFAGSSINPSATFLTISTLQSDTMSDRIEPDVFNIQESYVTNVSGIVFKNKAYITVTYGSGNTTNNRYYLYDFSIARIKKTKLPAWIPNTGVAASQFTIYGGRLYCQSSTANGRVYQMESGSYNDDGAAIDSYFWTKEYPGYANEINYQKDFRYANILLETSGNYYMDLVYRMDSDAGGGDAQQIYLNPGGSLWGTMVWGRDLWGGGNLQKEIRQFLGTSRGKRIQFKFSNQNKVDQKFKVFRLNFAYNVKGFR